MIFVILIRIEHLSQNTQEAESMKKSLKLSNLSFSRKQTKPIKKNYNPKIIKRIAGENIKKDDKKLNKELFRKMLNPYFHQ